MDEVNSIFHGPMETGGGLLSNVMIERGEHPSFAFLYVYYSLSILGAISLTSTGQNSLIWHLSVCQLRGNLLNLTRVFQMVLGWHGFLYNIKV